MAESRLWPRYAFLILLLENAPNGRDGLELLEQKAFDVIVSDVEMPVMDGMTMVQHIRRRHPRLAIIFITKLRKYLSQDPTVTLKSLKGVGVCLED